MNCFRPVLGLGVLLLALDPTQGATVQNTSTTLNATPVARPKLLDTSQAYHFELKTVWGHLTAVIKAQPEHFNVELRGDSSISGWSLLNERTKKIVSKSQLGPRATLRFEVGENFTGPYRLTVFFANDNEEVPVTIPLSPSQSLPADPTTVDALEDFQENPDRPYNSMVRGFYEKAESDYAKGDSQAALRALEKAEDLDPEQPQVESFLKKLHGTNSNTFNKSGEEVPNTKEGPAPVKKRTAKKAKLPKKESTLREDNSSPKTNAVDQAAKADQAYNLGLESYRQEDYAAAKKFWEETLQIDPTHQQAKRNLDRLNKEHPGLP